MWLILYSVFENGRYLRLFGESEGVMIFWKLNGILVLSFKDFKNMYIIKEVKVKFLYI